MRDYILYSNYVVGDDVMADRPSESFEAMLTGGHPNSLGRTIEVVDMTLANPARFAELFACYRSGDPIVRLRVSNAMKRIARENLAYLIPYIDRFIDEIGELQQDSAQWTLAQLFLMLENEMTASQKTKAVAIMQRNLADNDDWIVLKTNMETLAKWAVAGEGENDSEALKTWLLPHVQRLQKDPRKSVARQADKAYALLTK